MLNRLIVEATECDFKRELEKKKPKSWLKSVSAFANGIGGTLFFGVDDDNTVVGLSDGQADAEYISGRIKCIKGEQYRNRILKISNLSVETLF